MTKHYIVPKESLEALHRVIKLVFDIAKTAGIEVDPGLLKTGSSMKAFLEWIEAKPFEETE